MKQTKVKNIKKLRKGHIWPSVVFLLFSIVIAVLAALAIIAFLITYFAEDRLEIAYNNAESICYMISDELARTDERRVMRYLEEESGLSEAVYILDDHKNSLSGFGGQTYDLDTGIALELTDHESFKVYADRESKYYSIEDGNLHFDKILREKRLLEKNMGSVSGDVFRDREAVYIDYLWLEAPLPEHKSVMVKCKLSFYRKDFIFAAWIGALLIAFMLFPLLFLFINVIRNVMQQKRMTQLLYTNTVTGRHSWLYFEHYTGRVLRSLFNKKNLYAIVDISLMKYRSYCNYHGVGEGEKLLGNIDRQISSYLNKSEYCAHYGKSSYALLLKCDDKESGENRVRMILQNLPETVGHNNMVFHAGIYYVEPVIAKDSKKVLQRREVDIAEYYNHASSARASITDENQTELAVFDRQLLETLLWEHKVEEKMQQALEREEFQVYIQPKYNPVTEELAGAEALVRWINEEDGFISPGKFIPIFEKNGFITKLDDYMISHVAKLQAEWLQAGKKLVPVSVNVSRAHFANPDLARHICSLVDAYRLPHQWIEIELTESAFFDDKSALLNTVRELKKMGFDISMDDFGAGYSSLNSLKDLPLDVLKLDAEFFRGEEDEEKRGEIVVSEVIHLAKRLHMRIVAEGVEKKNQVDFLAGQECDMIQGYYYAKPMPAREYQERLE